MFTSIDSIPNLGSIIDASIYPYAKMRAYFLDNVSNTPAQIYRWQLLYDPEPELALNPALGFTFSALTDSLQQGQNVEFAIAIENISEFDMDSLLVHYWVEDEDRNRTYLPYVRQDSLRSGEVLYDTITFDTENYPNSNSLWIFANPTNDTTGLQDQLEQYDFNNIAEIKFNIAVDEMNPLLDVTFDGLHILDGDIVNAKPTIKISLDDENPYLLLSEDMDTSNFQVFILKPGATQYTQIRFLDGTGANIMYWTTATGPDNKFEIEYPVEFAVDGTYKLRVQANDKSANLSGEMAYEIEFEIINRSTITNLLNYPNPFSTRTQFVFELTGSVIPDQIRIQIMTITGVVVREINEDEIGPLRIGRNRTEFWWDGRDQFGDPLANGVYLYKVVTRINGLDVENRETDADNFFKKGFGKMYLMR
ncbi:MAG: hypothetical protein COB65_13105 [Thalassobium sp.]|nr:MAG: hypothetical protein COB65_13105 [Thalassobium sp.]